MSERMVVPIHGEDHCPGGPDPIPCLGKVDWCWMFWAGTGAVPVDTLSNPATMTGPDIPYQEGWSRDFGVFDGSINTSARNSGCINVGDTNGWFMVSAWALFNGGVTAGSHLGVVLDFGNGCSFSSYRVGNTIFADGVSEFWRIPVHRTFARDNDFGHDSVRLMVWHNDASGMDLNSAFISVTHLGAGNPSDIGSYSP